MDILKKLLSSKKRQKPHQIYKRWCLWFKFLGSGRALVLIVNMVAILQTDMLKQEEVAKGKTKEDRTSDDIQLVKIELKHS